jgi:hypothetical protein
MDAGGIAARRSAVNSAIAGATQTGALLVSEGAVSGRKVANDARGFGRTMELSIPGGTCVNHASSAIETAAEE